MPPHTIGLSVWTLLLPTEADVLAVRVRLDAAGLPADAAEGGFVTHDPWENAVVLRNEGGTQ